MSAIFWGSLTMVAIVVISIVLVFIAFKTKSVNNLYDIAPQETERFLKDSIAIQPNNRPFFTEQTADKVIASGFSIMKEENYRMSKGVDWDAI